jgi:hypothetical protein
MRRMILAFLLTIGFFHSFADFSSAQTPAPSITVEHPTAKAMETDEPSITLQGTATAQSEIKNVLWVNQFGKHGVGTFLASGGRSATWKTSAIMLRPGINLIAITIVDAENHSVSTHLAINRKVAADTQPSLPVLSGTWKNRPIVYQVWNGMAVVEGDIILGPASMVGSAGSPPVSLLAPHAEVAKPEGIGISYTSGLWPSVNGIIQVPYIITGSAANLNTALANFNQQFSGLIQFVPRTAQTNFVNISIEGGSSEGFSDVGMTGNEQSLNCGSSCTVATWMHEMGHTVGLLHEHQRPDSASYITLNLANADLPNVQGNFTPILSDVQTFGLFDVASIMEYGAFDFSKAGLPVIESIPPGIPLSNDNGYSAGDIDAVERLYSATPSMVTVTTNPPGLPVVVDGTTFATTPQAFSWTLGSTHAIGVPADPQTTNPNDGSTYAFGAWNDLGARTHTITVQPGAGTLTTPVSRPAVTVYQADYIRLQPFGFLSPASFPTGSGSVNVSPSPVSEFGGSFFTDRTLVTLTLVPMAGSGFNFYDWFNLPFPPSDNPHMFYIQAPQTSSQAVYVADPVTIVGGSITGPNTWNPGLAGTVDGGFAFLPTAFAPTFDGSAWDANTTHLVAVDQTQSPVTTNVFYNWNSWSDQGSISHSITQPSTGTQSITASFTPFYASFTVPPPLGSQNAACYGGVATTPAGTSYPLSIFDFYQDGTRVTSTATTNSAFSGLFFADWTGSLSGTTNPDQITIHDQFVPMANFNTIPTALAITGFSPASTPASSGALDLTINGTGFTSSTFVNWNGSLRSSSFVSPTQLTLHLIAGDLASPGGQDIFIGNNVSNGSSTCGIDAESSFTVTFSGTAVLRSITVTPSTPSIVKGATQQFTATGHFSDGTTQNLTASATWSSGTTTVATITAGGLATGAGVGTSTIAATSSSVTGSTALTVTAATLQSIAVTPANPSITKGATQQFTATGTFSDGTTQNLTSTATWSSGTTTVATITASGLATGAGVGSSTIKATSGTVNGSTALTVTAATLQSIAVTPANPSIFTGTTEQFVATGTYSDGSTQNITGSVTWTSGTSAIATINAAGLAIGIGPGISTIGASLSAVSGNTTLTVVAPIVQISSTLQSLSTNSSGQYIALIAVANQGNIAATATLASATLGSAGALTPLPVPKSVAPNSSVILSVTFPATAGGAGTASVLRFAGSYTALLPVGGATSGNWGASLRVVLP